MSNYEVLFTFRFTFEILRFLVRYSIFDIRAAAAKPPLLPGEVRDEARWQEIENIRELAIITHKRRVRVRVGAGQDG